MFLLSYVENVVSSNTVVSRHEETHYQYLVIQFHGYLYLIIILAAKRFLAKNCVNTCVTFNCVIYKLSVIKSLLCLTMIILCKTSMQVHVPSEVVHILHFV